MPDKRETRKPQATKNTNNTFADEQEYPTFCMTKSCDNQRLEKNKGMHLVSPTLELTKASPFLVFPFGQVMSRAPKVTNVSLFIVSSP